MAQASSRDSTEAYVSPAADFLAFVALTLLAVAATAVLFV